MNKIDKIKCVYLEENGCLKCTNKKNDDIRLKDTISPRRHKKLLYKRCCVEHCPLYNKEEYNKIFEK